MRLALVRWQLQTYLEYGGVLALYEELAQRSKPEDIDSLAIRILFQVRCSFNCKTTVAKVSHPLVLVSTNSCASRASP